MVFLSDFWDLLFLIICIRFKGIERKVFFFFLGLIDFFFILKFFINYEIYRLLFFFDIILFL